MASDRSGKCSGSVSFWRVRKSSKLPGIGRVREGGVLLAGNLDDAVPAFGGAHDAPDGGVVFGGQEAGGGAVGGDHEVFDDLHGLIFLFDFEVADLIAIEDGAGFDGFAG